MQQEKTAANNSVVIIGKIMTELEFSHQIYGEGFYTFALEASRLSDVSDLLPVTISDRITDKNDLSVGTLIKIDGQIRSYNSFVEAERKNKLILTVFARDVKIGLDESDLKQNPNEVQLNGYICKPPIFRTTPFGREIADILVAVNRSYNKSDYIPCIAWGRNARFASRLTIGESIRIWGRMQSRGYQKKSEDGQTLERTAYEVSISKIEYMNAADNARAHDEEANAEQTDGAESAVENNAIDLTIINAENISETHPENAADFNTSSDTSTDTGINGATDFFNAERHE